MSESVRRIVIVLVVLALSACAPPELANCPDGTAPDGLQCRPRTRFDGGEAGMAGDAGAD